ncbi:hypothetical protein [Nostoc parmelioides]|nr:hypothetical protein [Nostoc parmelioides]
MQRVTIRVTIIGNIPVGIYGKQSEAIKGDYSFYNRSEPALV